jgi:hypothetical protein
MFEDHVEIDEGMLCTLLEEKGERTFQIKSDNYWYHKRYGSDVNFQCDSENNIIIALITGGREYRTVGSYIEWILNNVEDRGDILNAITIVS